jgi:death on curing protein
VKEPYWLTRDECLALHDLMLSHYGGCAGLRDAGLLDSALARPRQLFHYGKPKMSELAGAYATGIVQNHPFMDGNKRTGFMMGAAFLERNDHDFFASEADAVVNTLALAAREIDEMQYALWLGANSKRRSR